LLPLKQPLLQQHWPLLPPTAPKRNKTSNSGKIELPFSMACAPPISNFALCSRTYALHFMRRKPVLCTSSCFFLTVATAVAATVVTVIAAAAAIAAAATAATAHDQDKENEHHAAVVSASKHMVASFPLAYTVII